MTVASAAPIVHDGTLSAPLQDKSRSSVSKSLP